MKILRKPTKVDKLLGMFPNIGDRVRCEEVCRVTGISNQNSLKALCSYIRRAKHVPDENRIDVRIKDSVCQRVL